MQRGIDVETLYRAELKWTAVAIRYYVRALNKEGSPLAKLRAEQMEIVKQKLEDIVEGGDRRIAVE